MLSTYESIIDNLNICKTLILEETVYIIQTKETKLNNLGIIKEKSVNFAVQGGFCGGQRGWGGRGGWEKTRKCIVSQTANGGYIIQGYSLRLAMNCYYFEKNGHGWRDYTLYLSTDKWKK